MSCTPFLPLQQSPTFAAALSDFGVDVCNYDPVIVRWRFALIGHVGFATRITCNTDQLRALRRDGLRILNGDRDTPNVYKSAGFHQIITPAHSAELDLRGSDADRRAALHPKWRNQLRRAEASHLRLQETEWRGGAHPLFDHAAVQARERRYRQLPHRLITAFAHHAPDAPLIFAACDKGSIIAAILILRHGTTATYQTAWTNPHGRACNAHNLLLFHAANRLSTLGHDTFDLGLVETDHGASLARFKLRTGATLRKLGGTWIALSGR